MPRFPDGAGYPALAAGFAALAAACAPLPVVRAPGPGDTVVHVVDLGWHTDLALPPGEVAVPSLAGTRAVLVGFGARVWYLAPAPGFREGARALLGGAGAVLVWPLPDAPETRFGAGQTVALSVSPEGMVGLRGFLGRMLPPGSARIADGPYPGSAFYETETRYGLFYTCNTWVVDALRAAGLPARPWGVVTAGQAMREVRRLEAAQRRAADAVTPPPPPTPAHDRSSAASPARPSAPPAGADPAPGPA